MYFSKSDGYFDPGVKLAELKPFFEHALDVFSVSSDGSLRETRFNDTLRELKSSFVVLC